MSKTAWVVVATAMLVTGATMAQVTNSYTYDAQGRLVTSRRSGSGTPLTTTYTFDDAHNRTTRSTAASFARAAEPAAASTAVPAAAAATSPPAERPQTSERAAASGDASPETSQADD